MWSLSFKNLYVNSEYLQKKAECPLFSTAFKVPLEIIEFLFFSVVVRVFEFIEN